MQLIHVFEILLLIAVIAGAFMPWERRKHEDHPGRGGRRQTDGALSDGAIFSKPEEPAGANIARWLPYAKSFLSRRTPPRSGTPCGT
jgi:hypothetical protein